MSGAAAFSLIALSLLIMVGSVVALHFAANLLQSAGNEVEAEFAFRAAEEKLHTSTAIDRALLSPTLQLIATTGVAKRFARRVAFLSTRGLPNLPHANWSRLLTVSDGCRRWNREIKSVRASTVLRSNFSCREFPVQFNGDSTTPGNLILESSFSLSGLDKGTARIAAVGEVSFRKLTISAASSASIELLAGGDLSIDYLVLSPAQDTTLLLYSATGKITVTKIEGPAFWCEGASPLNVVRIRFEARDIAQVEGRNVPRGCPTARDPQVWPALQILSGVY